MAVKDADLALLEAELLESFDQDDWNVSVEGVSTTAAPAGETDRGLEISMDLDILGGSRPRV